MGGLGADTFRFLSLDESPASAHDVIRDFSKAQGDKIDLAAIDANGSAAGDAFTFVAGAFTGGLGEVRSFVSGGNTFVAADVDGDKASDFHLMLTGAHTLGGADFVL
jgi:hypothetical protein